LEALLLSGTL